MSGILRYRFASVMESEDVLHGLAIICVFISVSSSSLELPPSVDTLEMESMTVMREGPLPVLFSLSLFRSLL